MLLPCLKPPVASHYSHVQRGASIWSTEPYKIWLPSTSFTSFSNFPCSLCSTTLAFSLSSFMLSILTPQDFCSLHPSHKGNSVTSLKSLLEVPTSKNPSKSTGCKIVLPIHHPLFFSIRLCDVIIHRFYICEFAFLKFRKMLSCPTLMFLAEV